MIDPSFTILLPVHRSPILLPYAIASVQAQERQDFELLVICDGASPETADTARQYAANDGRVRVFEHPKGERHGELYRDAALRDARGAYVCQLGDDDLWLPSHLSEIAVLLQAVDFGNLAQVEVTGEGTVVLLAGDLADAGTRHAMMTRRWNFFGPTAAGYRLAAYRALGVGWSPAPLDVPTDLFMWRKFLDRSDLRFGTRVVVSSIKFSAAERRSWPIEQRRAEIAHWAARLSSPAQRAEVAQQALLGLSRSVPVLREHIRAKSSAAKKRQQKLQRALRASRHRSQELARQLQKVRRSWSWRLTRPFRAIARRLGRRSRP